MKYKYYFKIRFLHW